VKPLSQLVLWVGEGYNATDLLALVGENIIWLDWRQNGWSGIFPSDNLILFSPGLLFCAKSMPLHHEGYLVSVDMERGM
jgi:hypothetical protein